MFVYGFAKNERDNIGKRELEFWRETASAALAMTDKQVAALLKTKDLTEVDCGD